LWMTSEAGNANFYYFQLIVIQLSIVLFLVEAITSARIVLDSHKKKRPWNSTLMEWSQTPAQD